MYHGLTVFIDNTRSYILRTYFLTNLMGVFLLPWTENIQFYFQISFYLVNYFLLQSIFLSYLSQNPNVMTSVPYKNWGNKVLLKHCL